MGRIRVLTDAVADRIAAGEVVERPASVAKELVENALDAGARHVQISIENGGRRSVVVEDDGEGMDRDDALLALERHATSKVREAEDLAHVDTLGFRGEAIPSIASVSHFTLTTSADDSGEAWRLRVRGGTLRSVEVAARARGTTVDVRNLFFNTPARKKFLKSEATETQRIVEIVTALALARHDVRFNLESSARSLVRAPSAPDLRARVAQIAGAALTDRLVPLELDAEGMVLRGFLGPPGESRSTRSGLYLWVNGRPVRDRVLQHALVEAYAESLPRGRYPIAFLGVDLPTAELDVNVHPAKTEVRFVHAARVHDALREAATAALRGGDAYTRAPRAWTAPTAAQGTAEPPSGADPLPARQASLDPVREGWSRSPAPAASSTAREPPPEGAGEGRGVFALAQYRNCYILGRDEDGLLVVDQHTAHERILYEGLLRAAADARVEVQRLLFPVTLDLGPTERLTLEEHGAALERMGFGLEAFGGDTVALRAIPSGCPAEKAPRLVRDLVQALREGGPARDPEEAMRRAAATAACHAAVKINDPLTREKMDHILSEVLKCRTPTHCPHGRPVMLRITLGEIEKAFGRTWGPR